MKTEIVGNKVRQTIQAGDHLEQFTVYDGPEITVERELTDAELAVLQSSTNRAAAPKDSTD